MERMASARQTGHQHPFRSRLVSEGSTCGCHWLRFGRSVTTGEHLRQGFDNGEALRFVDEWRRRVLGCTAHASAGESFSGTQTGTHSATLARRDVDSTTRAAAEPERQQPQGPVFGEEGETEDDSRSASKLSLVSGAASYPHPEKVEKGGEDAHFLARERMCVGVADGVGGCSLAGIDAGQYAKALMAEAQAAIEGDNDNDARAAVREALRTAHAAVDLPGSSTACMLCLDSVTATLHAVNIGDSGFLLVRNFDQVAFKSPEQSHAFNCPFQLGSDTKVYDKPDAAQAFDVPVEVGDVVVVATDGLLDNLFPGECAAMVGQGLRRGVGPEELAEELAAAARSRAANKGAVTPFVLQARSKGVLSRIGGKLDDITVVVCFVQGVKRW